VTESSCSGVQNSVTWERGNTPIECAAPCHVSTTLARVSVVRIRCTGPHSSNLSIVPSRLQILELSVVAPRLCRRFMLQSKGCMVLCRPRGTEVARTELFSHGRVCWSARDKRSWLLDLRWRQRITPTGEAGSRSGGYGRARVAPAVPAAPLCSPSALPLQQYDGMSGDASAAVAGHPACSRLSIGLAIAHRQPFDRTGLPSMASEAFCRQEP